MRNANKALSFTLVACMMLFLPQTALAADHGASNEAELTSALGAAASGDTIRLLADIDYAAGITISGKTLTFDLNGHTLNVTNATGSALDVGSGGVLSLSGGGALNVTSGAADGYGVNAHNGGQATVTNASATGAQGVGAHAIHAGSEVRVLGDAMSAGNIGALARGGGTVRVGGNARGVTGADAVGNGTLLEVTGNVTGNKGVACAMNAEVRVGGSVTATGGVPDARAISIAYGGTVQVAGNVTASGAGTVGAWVYDGGAITIGGTLLAPVYIQLQEVSKTAADGVPGTAPYESYLVYSGGSNTVRVRHVAGAAVDPVGASFDKAAPADVTAAITWNNATSVTGVTASGTAIGAANYSIDGNMLTVKKEYLAAQGVGTLTLSVAFDVGEPAALGISIVDSTPALTLAVSPSNGIIFTGGRVTVTPSIVGGEWSFDTAILSRDGNTFTGLKAGTARVTYTAGAQSAYADIAVHKAELPATGQSGTLALTLAVLAAGCASVAAAGRIIGKKQPNR